MRKFTSVVLAAAFLALFVSIGFMAAEHHGEQHRGGPRFAASEMRGRGRAEGPRGEHHEFFPMGLHELAGGILLIFGTVHLCHNWKPLMSYMGFKKRRK